MPDLTTTYPGLSLKNPLVASASPLSKKLDRVRRLEDAGAAAVVMYSLFEEQITRDSHQAELENAYINLVRNVRTTIHIPLAVKLSPFFTTLPHLARRFVEAGANGLVLFNRFYQPDFDLDNLEVVPHLELSTSHDLLLPLRWIAILYGRIRADFALTSGVHQVQDVVKAMMAGANVAMLASELVRNGPASLTQLVAGLSKWMEEHEYVSISQMRGSMSQRAVAEPAAFERADYMRALNMFDLALPESWVRSERTKQTQ